MAVPCTLRLLAWLLLALGCLVPVMAAPFPPSPAARAPGGGDSAAAAVRMRQRIPNVPLVTHENRAVRFYDDMVKGKVVLINFMYTDCKDICPITTAMLVQVQEALGDALGREVFLYSITLDPKIDTPEVLKRYANAVGARPGWYFFTGKRADIEQLRRKLGLYDRDPAIDADKTQHLGFLVYGSEPIGRWSMIPVVAGPKRIVRDLSRWAAENKSKSP